MSPLDLYFAIVLPLHVVEEVYHCNKIPTPSTDDWHLVCNWSEEDFEYVTTKDGTLLHQLKKEFDEDNYFKKKVRNKYWNNNNKQENTQ